MNPNRNEEERISQSNEDSDSDDEDKRTIFCAGLSEKVTEEILYELFLQAGPLESARIPKDKAGKQRSFGFVTYVHSCSVPYALELFEGVRLFHRLVTMRCNAHRSKKPPPSPRTPNNYMSEQMYSNSALRLGGSSVSHSHTRFDLDMQPIQHPKIDDRSRNPSTVDLDVLSRLGSNLLPPIEANYNRNGNPNNPFTRNAQSGGPDKITKHSSRDHRECHKMHPYGRSNKWGEGRSNNSGHSDRNNFYRSQTRR